MGLKPGTGVPGQELSKGRATGGRFPDVRAGEDLGGFGFRAMRAPVAKRRAIVQNAARVRTYAQNGVPARRGRLRSEVADRTPGLRRYD